MRTVILPLTFALCLAQACGDDSQDEDEEPGPRPEVTTGEVQGIGDVPVDERACVAFCEKANECARAGGRAVPPEAADCHRSCQEGGIHRQAPPAIHVCAAEACGPAFLECSRRAMISHMRDRDVAVFPPICQGLCEKSARCRRELGQEPGPGEDDCDAACQPGGSYADVAPRELLCVSQPCGPPFLGCRATGGPPDAVQENRPDSP